MLSARRRVGLIQRTQHERSRRCAGCVPLLRPFNTSLSPVGDVLLFRYTARIVHVRFGLVVRALSISEAAWLEKNSDPVWGSFLSVRDAPSVWETYGGSLTSWGSTAGRRLCCLSCSSCWCS